MLNTIPGQGPAQRYNLAHTNITYTYLNINTDVARVVFFLIRSVFCVWIFSLCIVCAFFIVVGYVSVDFRGLKQ